MGKSKSNWKCKVCGANILTEIAKFKKEQGYDKVKMTKEELHSERVDGLRSHYLFHHPEIFEQIQKFISPIPEFEPEEELFPGD